MNKVLKILKYGLIPHFLLVIFLSATTVSGICEDLKKERWEEIKGNRNYPVPKPEGQYNDYRSRNRPLTHDNDEKQAKPQQPDNTVYQRFDLNMPAWIKYLLYGVVIAGLVALIILLIIQRINPGRKSAAGPRIQIDEENPEELIKSELEIQMEEALVSGNYNRCLRIKFLLMLEQLQKMGLIVWHKYKTNGEYLRELSRFDDVPEIRDLTLIYEYFWYGEHILYYEQYAGLENRFDVLLNQWRREK
ncbi:MAG: hypothetical protein GC181_04475 [Bacteroidetes bacterium]|nr:hypothetical protein [Bacteroidota bacterium]